MPIITTDKELRPRDVNDHYPTPDAFVRTAFDLIPKQLVVPERIIDPGAGSGAFGIEARRRFPNAKIAGIETREVHKPDAYNSWLTLSFVGLSLPVTVDLVIGNPPYKYAEEAVRFGWDHLRPGGFMVYLLRLAFLEGQKRYKTLWQEMPPEHVAVCSNRPSFTGEWVWVDQFDRVLAPATEEEYRLHQGARQMFFTNGKTDATAYGFFIWRKPSDDPRMNAAPRMPTLSFVLSGDDDDE